MPSTKGYPIQHGIIINERKTCRHPPCSRNRTRLSAYCSTHYNCYHYYGHPDSRKIKPKEYQLEKRLVARVVNRNLDHAAIQQAIRFFDTWITRAVVGSKAPGGKYLARLVDKNVTGKECLIEIGAIWVFAWWNKRLFPSDRAMTYGLGTTILYFSHGCQHGERSREPQEDGWRIHPEEPWDSLDGGS